MKRYWKRLAFSLVGITLGIAIVLGAYSLFGNQKEERGYSL